MVLTIAKSVSSLDKSEPVSGLKRKREKSHLLEHHHPANTVESGGIPWKDLICKVIKF